MTILLPPNPHATGVLVLTAVALVLFSRSRIALETSSLVILVVLAVGFELFPFSAGGRAIHAVDFFHGFGNEALVAVCALMIAGQAVMRTGALEPVGRILARLWKTSPRVSFLLTLLFGAFLSAFINNVPVVVLLLPVLISVSARTGSPASAVLMPMGFSTLLGGMTTTIGTSTNLLVVSIAADMGLARIGMFDYLLPAVLAGSVGMLYLWLVAPRLLPKRPLSLDDDSPRVFAAHLALLPASPVVGDSLAAALRLTDGAMKVEAVERGQGNMIVPLPDVTLRAGDRLVLRDTPTRLKEYEKILAGTLYPAGSAERPVDDDHPLQAADQQIAEVVVIQGSPLQGSTLSSYRFADRYGLITLAIHRPGRRLQRFHEKIGDIHLATGDILLVQGPREKIAELKHSTDMLVLDAIIDLPFTRKAPTAMFIMKGIILIAAFGILPIAVSALCGVLLLIVSGCLSWRDATRALNAQVVLIVVTSLALGKAMVDTGGAAYLGSLFVAVLGDASPALVIAGLMLLVAFFTNVISNNAAAVIGTPIAISIAGQTGQAPEAYVLAVLFAANMSFATPMAYKTNLLIMTAGEYAFSDFLRVGLPLVLLMWLAFSFLLPLIYL
jgi:di/tricarboxylate transporter